jgi:hypothetical protein
MIHVFQMKHFLDGGKSKTEGRPGALFRFHPDFPPVGLHDPLDFFYLKNF